MPTSVGSSPPMQAKTTVLPPIQFEEEVVLGGSTLRVRPIRPEDEVLLGDFFRGLSQTSRTLRFFTTVKDDFLVRAAARFSKIDEVKTFGLIATAGGPERIVAHAMYAMTAHDRAEIAFAVAESWREHGLGTLLLRKMAQIASSRGVRVFEAVVLPENFLMLAMFRDSGFPVRLQTRPGEILVELVTDPSTSGPDRAPAPHSTVV